VAGRACLVVGGGRVAWRKVQGLLRCDAAVTVVAPEICEELAALAARVTLVRRPYQTSDVTSCALVVSATGDAAVDQAVWRDAETAGVWVNVADDAAHSSAILPAVHRTGPVSVAVSTSGSSPALAAWLRDRVAAELPERVEDLAALLARARRALQAAGRSTEEVGWRELLDGPLPALVAAGQMGEARRIVEASIGLTLEDSAGQG
jgi:siroheme synthase-like protein